jgi:hypothetical protein
VIQLGDRVRDMVTGLEGVTTSKTEWLNGCIRWGIEYLRVTKEGAKIIERETFDEEQLEVVKVAAVKPRRMMETRVASGSPLASPQLQRTGGGGRHDPEPHP